ncbi:NACHT, LRR and PYD domains-containing protein 14-like [Mobula hypostoma]|uniref:NACHT, LRR and PYD domains-containing protein 14-like n=1 Tax=Mobula hypostoma TaxID=723540 RepID=UPI002FC2ED8A
MRTSKPRIMLNFVLLLLLVRPVPCLPAKPEPDDEKHEVNVTDSRDRAEVHSRELNRTFRTSLGPDSRNEADNQLHETLEAGEANVDEGHKSASHIVGKTIDGSVPSRMIENRTLTAPKKELDTSERSEWSGWAMADAPALPDVQDREEKYNRNRRRKSTSDNFGPGYGWKSDIVHSTSFGKEVSGDNIVDKGRTLMLLDRETDASGEKKTAVEVQLCQYIGLPIGFAIVLAACAWLTRCWDRWWNRRHGYEPVDGENVQYNLDAEQLSIPGLGGATVSSEQYQDPGGLFQGDGAQTQPTDEDPGQAQRQPQPLEHAHAELPGSANGPQDFRQDSLVDQEQFQDVEQLHKCHLRDQNKHWKGTENERSILTVTRNFDDFYIDLCVIATARERLFIEDNVMQEKIEQNIQVEFHQLFRSGKSLTNNTTITVVCGAAGTGKSTMVQKVIHDWSTGTMYKQFKFVFYFPVRKLNAIKRKTNLNTLILDAYPHFRSNLENLWEETNNILFILDDFDRFEGIGYYQDEVKKENPQQKCLEPQSVCLVSDIVHSLLQGDLLKGCSLLITTRPWNLETLLEAPIDSTFQIIGFTADQVKQYFNRYFRDGLQAEYVITLILQSDILRNMCRNPLFCSALCSSLKSQQIQGESSTCVIHNSLVFSSFFALLLERAGYNVKTSRNSFCKLGELAYTGIGKKQFSFKSDKLSDLNLYLPNLASTFMYQVQDSDRTASLYKFAHSFIQDFVAAVSKRLRTPGIELQRTLDEKFMSSDDRWVIFSRFLVGLCSGKSNDLLEGLLGKFTSDVSLRISDWLSETIKRRIENLEGTYTQNTFLNILHFLFEFGDMQLTKNILTAIPAIKFNQCVLRPSDCTVISSTLTCSERVTEMDLNSCHLQLEGIQQLEPVLHKCEILRLNGNDLKDAGVKFLSEVLKRSDCNVQRLELNGNDLRDAGVKFISEVLKRSDCNVQILELKSNKLTDDCLEGLFSTLARNRSLTRLDLSNSTEQEEEANRLTDHMLHNVIQSSDLKKKIRLIRSRDFEQNTSKDETELNVLTVITE